MPKILLNPHLAGLEGNLRDFTSYNSPIKFDSSQLFNWTPQYLSEIFVARERVSDLKTWLGG